MTVHTAPSPTLEHPQAEQQTVVVESSQNRSNINRLVRWAFGSKMGRVALVGALVVGIGVNSWSEDHFGIGIGIHSKTSADGPPPRSTMIIKPHPFDCFTDIEGHLDLAVNEHKTVGIEINSPFGLPKFGVHKTFFTNSAGAKYAGLSHNCVDNKDTTVTAITDNKKHTTNMYVHPGPMYSTGAIVHDGNDRLVIEPAPGQKIGDLLMSKDKDSARLVSALALSAQIIFSQSGCNNEAVKVAQTQENNYFYSLGKNLLGIGPENVHIYPQKLPPSQPNLPVGTINDELKKDNEVIPGGWNIQSKSPYCKQIPKNTSTAR